MNCGEVISTWLTEHGYDGLVGSEGECGCGLDDLFPCGHVYQDCEPGYKGTCSGCGETIYCGNREPSKCLECEGGGE